MQVLQCLEGSSIAYIRYVPRTLRHYSSTTRRESKPSKEDITCDSRDDGDHDAGISARKERPTLQRVERPLPLSPIVDPKAIEARTKWSAPKPAPKGPPQSAFQAKLLNNPYAQALATPMRLCAITKARLPNYFLVEFDSIKHPETGRPWFYPDGLQRKPRKRAVVYETEDQAVPEGLMTLSPAEDRLKETKAQPKVHDSLQRRAVPGKALARYSLYRKIGDLNKTQSRVARNIWATLLHSTANRPSAATVNLHVFREDMYDFLLDMIRIRVLKELEVIHDRGKDYMSFVEGGLDIALKLNQAGAILCFCQNGKAVVEDGQPPATLSMVSNDTIPVLDIEILSTASSSGGSRSLAIYDLPRLLGKQQMEALQRLLGLGDGVEYALLKNKRATLDVQSWLWKLHGYLNT